MVTLCCNWLLGTYALKTARVQSKQLIRVLMSQFLRGQVVRSRRVFEKMLTYQRAH